MYGYILACLLALFPIVQAVYIYLEDPKRLRRFPGVSIAPLTNAWGVIHQYHRSRTIAVHKAHMKYGEVVRVGPKHISFATLQAIRDVYGHGTPVLKDNFYGAFTSSHLNVSDSQEKAVHNIKRKRFAAAFAQRSIVELEHIVGGQLERVMRILDNEIGQEIDMKQMMLGLMYNIIAITMYNQDPRFVENGSAVVTAETLTDELYKTDLHEALCGSLHISTSLGWAPESIPLVKTMTRGWKKWKDGDRLRDVTLHFVRNRLRMDTERVQAGLKPLDDFMTTLLWDKKGNPLCLDLGELVTEAQNLFNAAGENTEIALTNIIWLMAKNPCTVKKLRGELDDAFKKHDFKGNIPPSEIVKDLPYLRACIDEGIRLRPSLPGGLPRIVPKGGLMVSGHWLEEGTTVSVSTHTVHRDERIFFEEAEKYIPDRWLRENASELQRGFLGFSQGGRACLGRNIAYFQMQLVIATLFAKYDFFLRSPDWELEINETFSAHTYPLPVTVQLRRT